MAIFLNLFIPFLTFSLIYTISIETSPQFAFCVGKSYYNFLSTGHEHCSLYENMFSKAVCVGWTSFLILLMSNIFDMIFVYFCAKAIEDQTEASKEIISKNEYVKRRRYVLTNGNTFHFSFGYRICQFGLLIFQRGLLSWKGFCLRINILKGNG